jgi:hypothetical protein
VSRRPPILSGMEGWLFWLAMVSLVAGIAVVGLMADADLARARRECEAKGPEWTLVVSKSGRWCAVGNWAK